MATVDTKSLDASTQDVNAHLDAIDAQILAEAMANRGQIPAPRMGDFVRFSSGEIERFSHNWGGDAMQTSPKHCGSFYLYGSGGASFSGSLNPSTPIELLRLTDETMMGEFWFFHHGHACAHNGVYFSIPCRVYTTTAEYTGFIGKSGY